MKKKTPLPKKEMLRHKLFKINTLIPHFITVMAICSGLSSIRFSLESNFLSAAIAIFLACVFDGLDGKVARLLNTTSSFGAELDSLADTISFGVAPALFMYLYQLRSLGRFGWAICMFYCVCVVLRLARFNVMLDDEAKKPMWSNFYAVGAPAPAGAILTLSPFIFAKAFSLEPLQAFLCAIVVLVSCVVTISAIPTFSLKNISLTKNQVPLVILLISFFFIFSFSFPWLALCVIIFSYMLSLPFLYFQAKKLLKTSTT